MLLNLEPDHLDRHGTAEAYRDAKLRIFENQGEDDIAVVPRGFPPVPGRGRRVEFDADDPLPAEPLIRGAHNRENAAAATAAARALGVADERIAEALATFPGVPHRLELRRANCGGVRFVNDSKATNVAAARRALAAYADDPVHLILGGSRKGEDYAPLVAAIGPNVRAGLPDRRDRGGARRCARRPRAPCAPATSRRQCAWLPRRPRRATSSCSRRPARASTSTTTSSSAARTSGGSWRTSLE